MDVDDAARVAVEHRDLVALLAEEEAIETALTRQAERCPSCHAIACFRLSCATKAARS